MTASPVAAPRRGVAGVDEIRSHFPALERQENGQPVAYFDGPGGTQVPRAVVDAMADYLYHHNANTAWQYPSSVETDQAIADARRAMGDFVNASPDEIAFGANMTTLTFHVARALGRGWGAGDEIVVTELDHHANVAPWEALARERGVSVQMARMNPGTGCLDWDDLERHVTSRTRLVAIGAASNALGTVNDVAEAVQLARSVGALTFVDAVHSAPHELVDVRAMQCDFLACSAYKFYGPHVGVLYGRRALLEELDVPKLVPAPDTAPDRLETGTQNHEGIVGTAAAVDFLATLAAGESRRQRLITTFTELRRRGAALLQRLWEGLESVKGVSLYGCRPGEPRTPTLAFTMGDVPSNDVARRLSSAAIFASSGDFYAATVVERLRKVRQGLVRAGCACYTTEAEVDRFVDGIREIARGR
jgi:cysteine desulfurase family protein (TIGR01976 family)